MNNLEIYEKVRKVPNTAQREIEAGRLKGKTDINPMWRIKTLTELFGPCGYGWCYKIINKWLEPSKETGEIAAFIDIELYVKFGSEWSIAIPGTGGSMFVSEERNGLHLSDECYKMALTDAISVACKALGVGADIYWGKDGSKYTQEAENTASDKGKPAKAEIRRSAPPEEEAPPVKEKPSDVLQMDGADEADNRTLFANALRIGGIKVQRGRELLDEMYGAGVQINDLSDKQIIEVLKALDKMAV